MTNITLKIHGMKNVPTKTTAPKKEKQITFLKEVIILFQT